jgi:hypothetical protein
VLHDGGSAVLRAGDLPDVRLPDDLRTALREWAEVAEVVLRTGDVQEVDLLRRRGRQLATRVAGVLGTPVEFVDPVSGAVESIGDGTRVPVSARQAGGAAGDGGRADRQQVALDDPGPTPWGPGMAVAAFFAVVVAIADIVLADAFAGAFGLLWVPANLLVTAGTMPSLWLAREAPFWRWPAFGAAAGVAAAWIVMVLGLLAP